MNKLNLLDCTLRDGGYITDWKFDDGMILETIQELISANFDFVEVGYVTNKPYMPNTTQFNDIEHIASFLPKNRNNSIILAMADVQTYTPADITPFTGNSIDGIRIVFYKHQVEEALELCKAVKTNGYKLFIQPMVTIDYSLDEYAKLINRFAELQPFAVSIVDSFGYMIKSDFRQYFNILDNILSPDAIIGFHSHNNMCLAFVTAQDIFDYITTRRLVIDASLYGMGRGAGNLNTELIANYYNMVLGKKYNMEKILYLIDKYILPIDEKRPWGYSPYLFLTGLYKLHPNYACYLLEEHKVTVQDFEKFINLIPEEMRTKCRKPYVLEMWEKLNHEK